VASTITDVPPVVVEPRAPSRPARPGKRRLVKYLLRFVAVAYVAALVAKHDDQAVKDVVTSLSGLFASRQIIQTWTAPATDIEARGQAWDIFLNGVDALSGDPSKLKQYFSNCLAHDKGYGQIHEATQGYLLLGSSQEEPFETVVRLALAEVTNTNIWMGGQKGSGKIKDQLMRGFDKDIAKRSLKDQESEMWTRLLTSIVNAHSPGKPDWMNYPKVIRTNASKLFAEISAIVPGALHEDELNEALEMLGA